ncbi:MAG: hypothetical protein DRP71_14855 [Verrucomicrobia bacterium]|nr:MAG: hypothetical protein DRP71_14855 [Verrucomicrobiota bacterium]
MTENDTKCKLALIGCGGLGRVHAECISKIDGAAFSAYADIDQGAADRALADFGGDYATTDVAKVFEDPRIEAVYICTRHDSHASLAIDAARAGKHVLIEKPLALDMTDCEKVAATIRETGTVLMPAFKMRYYPLIRKAREFIPHPSIIVGQMMDNRWGDDNWAQDPIQGGANVHSQGCHTTDIIRYFSGSEPESIWAVGGMMTHPGHACIDQCVASIRFKSGCVASWVQGDSSCPPFTSKFFFQLYSADGRSVQLYDRLKKATFFDGEKTWTEVREDEEGFQLENEAFIKALSEGRQPALQVDDCIQATRIVLAADKAIRTGEVQNFTT